MLSIRHAAKWFATLSAVYVLCCCASDAIADAATHQFTITSATTMDADCGGDGCTTSCVLHAELKDIKFAHNSDVIIYLNFQNKNVDYAESDMKHSSLQFYFSPSPEDGYGETVDHVLGMSCSEVVIDSVEASCNADMCPFINVQIEPFPEIGLKGQKVVAEEE